MNIYDRNDYLRGDIYYIKGLGYASDSGLESGRPGIIVSNDAANKFSPNVTVVPLTSRDKKPLPTHASVDCKMKSTALCESMQTVSKSRIGDYIKHCTNVEMDNIDEAISNALALKDRTESTCHKIVSEPTIETQLSVAIAERNVYKKLYSQLLSRFTRILRQ